MQRRAIKQAVILAGGKGLRLRPLTKLLPKPMVPIHGKPFLEHLVNLLKQNGITDILILTGYLHGKIENYFGNGEKFGVNIFYSFSPTTDRTGARLRKSKKYLKKHFLLLYSDNYWPLRLNDLYNFYNKKKVLAAVTVYTNKDNYTRNNILIDDDFFIKTYDKENRQTSLNGVDIGFFILNKKVIDYIPNANVSFEDVVFPKLISEKQFAGFVTNQKYYGLSNLKRIPQIEKFFEEKKVVFLDRDGVINKKAPKAHYITKWEEFIFLPRVKDALKKLTEKGYLIFIVTSQACIARNIVTQNELEGIHNKMQKELQKLGVVIKGIYVCPHGWSEGCSCRKPKSGLFLEAASDFAIDLTKSYCIGDDQRDIIAGKSVGCKTFLINKKRDLYHIVQKYL